MLMYIDRLENLLDFGHRLLIFLVLVAFRLSETGQICDMMTSSNGNISALLALCAENSPVTGEFHTQRPVTRSFDVFFELRLNKWLSKQSLGWWFETPPCSLWHHCNGFPGIFLRTQGRNGLKFGMLIYCDHLQNRLDFSHGVLIFLILAPFWLSETGQIWAFRNFL